MNKNIEIKIKKLHPDAVIPSYATKGSGLMDVVATSIRETTDFIEYGTGLAFELPKGYVMRIYPRSSNSKYDLLLTNSVGNLDSDYRGELLFRYKRTKKSKLFGSSIKKYKIGDRIGQICIEKVIPVKFTEVEDLSVTERDTGGFGSTGN